MSEAATQLPPGPQSATGRHRARIITCLASLLAFEAIGMASLALMEARTRNATTSRGEVVAMAAIMLALFAAPFGVAALGLLWLKRWARWLAAVSNGVIFGLWVYMVILKPGRIEPADWAIGGTALLLCAFPLLPSVGRALPPAPSPAPVSESEA